MDLADDLLAAVFDLMDKYKHCAEQIMHPSQETDVKYPLYFFVKYLNFKQLIAIVQNIAELYRKLLKECERLPSSNANDGARYAFTVEILSAMARRQGRNPPRRQLRLLISPCEKHRHFCCLVLDVTALVTLTMEDVSEGPLKTTLQRSGLVLDFWVYSTQ